MEPIWITEEQTLPPVVTAVKTAITAFIGFTQKKVNNSKTGPMPVLISSMAEYEAVFGGPHSCQLIVPLNNDNTLNGEVRMSQHSFLLHPAVRHYFDNGGEACYIVSAATYAAATAMSRKQKAAHLLKALKTLEAHTPTLLAFPDAALLLSDKAIYKGTTAAADTALYYELFNKALQQCAALQDRFAILDVWHPLRIGITDSTTYRMAFREGVTTENLSYGAAYFPWLQTTYPLVMEESTTVLQTTGGRRVPKKLVLRKADSDPDLSDSLYHWNAALYTAVTTAVATGTYALPPSAAVAGIYATADKTVGVWKAPANLSLNAVLQPLVPFNNEQQPPLDEDPVTGKSINAIRTVTGKGTLVWGARTLAGNDNEWRYIPVRRFFIMVATSVKQGLQWVLFEPNDNATWNKAKVAVVDFLFALWKQGALQGAKPEQAFFVKVGLGTSMTQADIDNGRLIVEIGMAPLRPAEFIILRITLHCKSA